VYDSLTAARDVARKLPKLGRYIATLSVDDDGPIAVERTGRDPGHYTLWGDPSDVEACLVIVTRTDAVD